MLLLRVAPFSWALSLPLLPSNSPQFLPAEAETVAEKVVSAFLLPGEGGDILSYGMQRRQDNWFYVWTTMKTSDSTAFSMQVEATAPCGCTGFVPAIWSNSEKFPLFEGR